MIIYKICKLLKYVGYRQVSDFYFDIDCDWSNGFNGKVRSKDAFEKDETGVPLGTKYGLYAIPKWLKALQRGELILDKKDA